MLHVVNDAKGKDALTSVKHVNYFKRILSSKTYNTGDKLCLSSHSILTSRAGLPKHSRCHESQQKRGRSQVTLPDSD